MWWHTLTHEMGSEGETGEWSGWPVPFTLPRDMVYPELLPLMRTPRLPVVDWTDAPAGLNGLVRFAERRNLVSVRVSSFKTQSTTYKGVKLMVALHVMLRLTIHEATPLIHLNFWRHGAKVNTRANVVYEILLKQSKKRVFIDCLTLKWEELPSSEPSVTICQSTIDFESSGAQLWELQISQVYFFYRCTVHSDIHTVHSPTDAHLLKLWLQFALKLDGCYMFRSTTIISDLAIEPG